MAGSSTQPIKMNPINNKDRVYDENDIAMMPGDMQNQAEVSTMVSPLKMSQYHHQVSPMK